MFRKVKNFELHGRICEVVATERLNISTRYKKNESVLIKRLMSFNVKFLFTKVPADDLLST